jgi:phosphate butyryltransferase
MLKDFKALRELVGAGEPKIVAVACAHDAHTLEAVLHANGEGILNYVLVGHREEILSIGRELGHAIDPGCIVDAETDEEAAFKAVELIREGKADFLQKGYMQTSTILKAVVNKQTGIGMEK